MICIIAQGRCGAESHARYNEAHEHSHHRRRRFHRFSQHRRSSGCGPFGARPGQSEHRHACQPARTASICTLGDVTDPAAVAAAVVGCDAILHLAALVSVPQSMREPAQTLQINTTGTALLLAAAQEQRVRRFVLASTCAVYGDLPGRKDETAPLQPMSPYAAAKQMAEVWVQLYARAYGLETVDLALLQRLRAAPARRLALQRGHCPLV